MPPVASFRIYAQDIVFTVTIAPGAGSTTGESVTLYDGATSLGSATLNASGIATFSFGPNTVPTLQRACIRSARFIRVTRILPPVFRPGWFYNEPQDHIDPMERDLALPVRRPRGKDRSAVFAVPTEIDLWLRSRPARSLPANGAAYT